VKQKTSTPVPEVLAWSADASNPVGAEYMILEKVPGIQLSQVWNELNVVEHLNLIKSISGFCRELCKVDFPAYGSLYFNDDKPPGAIEVDSTFCIGPLTAAHQWGCVFDSEPDAGNLQMYQGPCKNNLVPLVLT
jgi:hypothetical protein